MYFIKSVVLCVDFLNFKNRYLYGYKKIDMNSYSLQVLFKSVSSIFIKKT